MPALIHIATPMSESERNARVYAGDIIVFHGHPCVVEFVNALRGWCVSYLGNDPEQVHVRESSAVTESRLDRLRGELRDDELINDLWRAVLEEIGVDVNATYGDGVVVRGQAPKIERSESRLAPLPPHRDTWGSNIAAQTNWWAPLYATTPERTLALYPGYFQRFVPNNSAGWDFQAMVRAQKTGDAYPRLPTANESLPNDQALPISLLPGDLLCFSGAHLHASVPNTTETMRLSFETRTVNGGDTNVERRGAPNVDSSPIYTTYQLFNHLVSGQKLGDVTRTV